MINRFSAGQLVKVNAPRCLAYGRYGLVLMTRGDQSQIRFADLPKASQPSQNPAGFVQFFSHEDLELIEGVPIAACYLLISVSTLVGTQEYIRYAIAHGDIDEAPEAIANTVAARFFGSLGDWDGEFYLWQNSPHAAKLLKFELITVAQYIELSRTTPDYNLGADRAINPL